MGNCIISGGSGGGLTMDLLWENDSPTSEFPGIDLTSINVNDYKFILIYSSYTTSYTTDNNVSVIVVGKNSWMTCPKRNVYSSRYVKTNYTNTGIHFDMGRDSSGNQDNSCCIPMFIYGVK